jgi:hypothetical protein
MKMAKKILAVLFMALVVTLTACSGDYGSNQSDTGDGNANTNARYQPENNSSSK